MQRLEICNNLARPSISMTWGSAFSRRTYFEMVYMISLGDLMFEVLCEKKGQEHVTPTAIEHFEKQELKEIIRPHLSLQMHQQSLTIFSNTAYDCITKQPHVDYFDIRKQLGRALELQAIQNKFHDLEIPSEEIASITNNFADRNLIYKGAFVNVYKKNFLGFGKLGNIIVQRRIDDCVYEQWEDELWKDLLNFSAGSQSQLSVLGFSDDKNVIIYEHVGNESLKKDVNDPTFTWMERLQICDELAWNSLSMSLGLCFDRRPYFEMVCMICLSDLMFEVLCEEKGDEHVTTTAIKHYEKGDLENIIHPHLREQMHQQSFAIFSNLAYDCMVRQPPVDIVDIRKGLEKAVKLQAKHERFKRFADMEIPFEEIASATNNFGDQSLMYKDEYINVYKGKVLLGSGQLGNIVVQRRLDDWNELLETFYLDISVVGFCADKKIIVYEHLGNQKLKKDKTEEDPATLRMAIGHYEKTEQDPATLKMAIEHYEKGELKKLIHPNLRVQMHHQSLTIFSDTAYACIKRPSTAIGAITRKLQKASKLQIEHDKYLEHCRIRLADIRLSTKNFAEEYFFGSGTYGRVYKAELDYFDRKSWSVKRGIVAIKSISNEGGQGDQGFFTELDMLSSCQHCNIISLLGYCHEGSTRILVYEYAFKQSLSDYLGSTDDRIILNWAKRLQICLDIAQGLRYLHNSTKDKPKIIHRDIKSDNILLGENWNAKIGDFGLSKFHPMNQEASTINTKIVAGTPFYVDPEYEKTGQLKKESDVYSFGVVLFEIISGRLAYDSLYLAENYDGLPAIARQRFSKGTLKDMIDPQMKEADEFISTLYYGPNHDSLDTFLNIAHQCLAERQIERPSIEYIIKDLQKENRRDVLTKFSFRDINFGTENFSDNNCIIRGAFGKAYKGKVQYHNELKDVVVMRLHTCSQDYLSLEMTKDNFLMEHEILMKHRHENIIDLVGYSRERNEKIIVYELASVGTLEMHLSNATLGWVERLKICIDVASGLEFLHESVQVIHRDVKSSSILLDGHWRAKISDFGLSLEAPINKKIEDYDMNDVISTPGYCDPSYWGMGFLTKESDIYSLGVVLFEILCGRSTLENYNNEGKFLGDSVKRYLEEKRLDEIVFKEIKKQIMPRSLAKFQMIANQCLHHRRQKRPTAAEVVVQLKKAMELQMEHSSARVMGSDSPKGQVPNLVGYRDNNKGIGLDCSENTVASRLDDFSKGPELGHDGGVLKG